MSFGFHPQHIVTRGRFDGQYGIATRGILICPDIVPRFPAKALVADLDLIGRMSELDPGATVGNFEPATFIALVDGRLQLVAEVGEDEELIGLVNEDEPPHC